MGIDDVHRKFQPKSTWVRLECENCGEAPEDVRAILPRWFTGQKKVCLCLGCGLQMYPTNPVLIAQRDTATAEAGYKMTSSSMS